MKNFKFALLFLYLISFQSKAQQADNPHKLPLEGAEVYSSVEDIPVRLLKLHLVSIAEKQCTDVVEQLETERAVSWQADAYTRIHAIPCALWGDNQSWKIYFEFNEPELDGHGLFKRALFSSLDWKGNIVASDIVHLWIWEEGRKALRTMFLMNGRVDCGSQYDYAYDDGTLQFKLIKARLKFKCDGQEGEWPEISLPKVN